MALVIKSVTPVNALVGLAFDSGSVEPTVGETVTGATSTDTAIVYSVTLSSGSWAVGNAAGNLVLISPTGYKADYSIFADNELLNGSTAGNNFATANGTGTVETENLGETATVYYVPTAASILTGNMFDVGETVTGETSKDTGVFSKYLTPSSNSYCISLSSPTGYTAGLEIFQNANH